MFTVIPSLRAGHAAVSISHASQKQQSHVEQKQRGSDHPAQMRHDSNRDLEIRCIQSIHLFLTEVNLNL
jgi:hypothetical protein